MPHSMSRDLAGAVRHDRGQISPSIAHMPHIRAIHATIAIAIAVADSISCRKELGA